MGACDFTEVGFGRDAEDAYDKACEQARYEHGHGGYTGTIAETCGFVEVELPKGMKADEFNTLVRYLDYGDWVDVNPVVDGRFVGRARHGDVVVPPVRRKFNSEWEKREYIERRKAAQRFNKLDARTKQMIRTTAIDRMSKYGPCTAVALSPVEQKERRAKNPHLKGKRGRFYLFTGVAAE